MKYTTKLLSALAISASLLTNSIPASAGNPPIPDLSEIQPGSERALSVRVKCSNNTSYGAALITAKTSDGRWPYFEVYGAVTPSNRQAFIDRCLQLAHTYCVEPANYTTVSVEFGVLLWFTPGIANVCR